MNKVVKKYLFYLILAIFFLTFFALIIHFKLYLYFFYFIYLIVFIVYSLFALNQLHQYSYVGDASRPVIVIYITISASVVLLSLILLFFAGGINVG